MLRTPVGLAVTGIVVGGAVFAVVAVYKIVTGSIDAACRTIGR